jgi:hypothetical protein
LKNFGNGLRFQPIVYEIIYYENVASLLKKMIQIEGGREVVKEMICQYQTLYKNRRAMMEIINRFSKEHQIAF